MKSRCTRRRPGPAGLVSRALAIAFIGTATGCTSAPKTNLPIPWTAPEQFDATLREDHLIFHTRNAADGASERILVGHLYHQANPDDEIHWVLDRDRRPLGFLQKSLVAFKLVEEKDAQGKARLGHKELGAFSLQEGVARILELSEGAVEFERTLSRGKAEARRKSESPATSAD